MKSEAKRFLGYTAVLIASIIYLVYRYLFLSDASDFHKEILVGLSLGIIITCATGMYETVKCHGKYFWTAMKCALLIPNKKVYISLSYLLKIKLKGTQMYFLVKGSKIDQYQPVGGVYKLVGNKDIYKDWWASPKADRKNPRDLRFFVRARHIPKVIDWFKSGKDREVGVWREFCEEMVETGIVGHENFKNINAEHLRYEEQILIKEKRFEDETYHTLIYDICEVELTNEQFKELEQLYDQKKVTKNYAFVTKDEIEKECFDEHKKRIGKHTKYIL